MNISAEAEPVPAKKKGRPKSTTRDDATTKFDRRLLGKAHLISKDRGVPVAEVISEAARPRIEKDYAGLVRRIDESEMAGDE